MHQQAFYTGQEAKNAMTSQHKYIGCVLAVGIHIANSYYNETVKVKNICININIKDN
jgi:putative aminopeptidase FrvX